MSGKPSFEIQSKTYRTAGGIGVQRTVENIPYEGAIDPLIHALDSHRGLVLTSGVEYPGRYSRWDIGFVDPPLALECRGRAFRIFALNSRGRVLLTAVANVIHRDPAIHSFQAGECEAQGMIVCAATRFPEEQRSRQPSIFSLLRTVRRLFESPEDSHLGMYGAFGYDLALQFEPLHLKLDRPRDQRDLLLYIPDQLVVVDHCREAAIRCQFDFETNDVSTRGFPREGPIQSFIGQSHVDRSCDHEPGEYAEGVRVARRAFERGDLFEVVPGQKFFEPCLRPPSQIFSTLRERNPAPYSFLINLGDNEYLIGASPEMYVRVFGKRVETCPIAGTIARGSDSIGDAAQIFKLLSSVKEESELTMCTDVDRNDKSRICEPGSVRVIGRRQIEMYSRLIHTVDHVEGTLRPEFDALDAFLAHAWAVTVTGAPKLWAMQFLEDHEKSPRAWYGGAVGYIGFDGNLNTGLTLRTIRVIDGVAEVRAGATLLHDSIPEDEERETRLKAAALIDAIRGNNKMCTTLGSKTREVVRKKVLLVDHQDSFVHTLANYLRQTGAEVVTLRSGFSSTDLDRLSPDLMVLSPGPGCPQDFDIARTLTMAVERNLHVFGVCLGLQGMVEFFGGKLGQLKTPVHGKPSQILVRSGRIFRGLPNQFEAGRYHSLYAIRDAMPSMLRITAESEDGVVMAIEHSELPMSAVQFHPESILTLSGEVGLRLIRNVMDL